MTQGLRSSPMARLNCRARGNFRRRGCDGTIRLSVIQPIIFSSMNVGRAAGMRPPPKSRADGALSQRNAARPVTGLISRYFIPSAIDVALADGGQMLILPFHPNRREGRVTSWGSIPALILGRRMSV